MDRLIYIAGSGAKQVMEKQATASHNLANVSTTGFRAQVDSFRAAPVISEGAPTRAFVVNSTVGADYSSGPVQTTGRDLDVAIQGKGWLAVQGADGTEVFTRSGALQVNEAGILQTSTGLNVVGDGGDISIPPGMNISIAKDGTVSGIDSTGKASVTVLGRLKLVNPDEANIVRREDGLFKLKDGAIPEADTSVSLIGGALEGSNVNVVDAMVSMISLGRQFEMQMKLITTAETDAAKADQILSLS